MRHSLLALALLSSLAACQKAEAPGAADTAAPVAATAGDTAEADAKFADLSKRALDGWFQLSPVGATQIGEHKYDGEIDDLSATGRQKGVDFGKKILAESGLAIIPADNLADAAQKVVAAVKKAA